MQNPFVDQSEIFMHQNIDKANFAELKEYQRILEALVEDRFPIDGRVIMETEALVALYYTEKSRCLLLNQHIEKLLLFIKGCGLEELLRRGNGKEYDEFQGVKETVRELVNESPLFSAVGEAVEANLKVAREEDPDWYK